ncbi:homeobox-domain-containing protein [Trametes versicolor FP-101664 SS1]|uniref:homeobox-domain-containing protein n=1 Tax=Trametes versicolor (strain FP-101664) TaxID=717944 RepID=UPI0004623021|nr:homeobox-domain-containing protein [Trametes versicolor FP-101664 SS1]EIW57792.1 homeobox-domain-containing protein [Trametes versicolor FP-101664 SS1]
MSLSSLAAGGKQRRKRSRTTQEQLAKLEEYFAADQSPTSARRRDIAQELGLDERQTQIWFQNRRAKVKLQAKMRERAAEKLLPPPRSPPPLTSGFDAEIYNLIHEDEEVTLVPCTDLTIGTWRRVASADHELIAYTCETRRCITWFVRSDGYSFKMEVPYDSITQQHFLNVSPGVGSVGFTLERPPTFYVERVSESSPDVEPVRSWQLSGDWTEGSQASGILQHSLMGPAYQLAHLVNTISPPGNSPEVSFYPSTPSISDVGSSPEVYSRSCESPVDPHPYASSLVLRRPSSTSSLRMLHHPSLERLRPSRHASVPMFHSPLSNMSTPSSTPMSPRSPADMSGMPAPMLLYADSSVAQQQYIVTQGPVSERLPRLQLAMPNLPGLNYEYNSAPDSPYGYATEPPSSAASTPGYYNTVESPIWEEIVPDAPYAAETAERPQQAYYHYPDGIQGPSYDRGGGAC